MNIKPSVWKFVLDVRSELGFYNMYQKVVSLLFLKWLMENSEKIGESMDSSFRKILEFKTKVDKVIAGNYIFEANDFEKVLAVIDDQLLTAWEGEFLYSDFYRTYYDMFQKKDSDRKIFKSLMMVDLPSEKDEWIELLNYLLENASNDMMRTQENSSSTSIARICLNILNVGKNDRYFDPFCGFSTSLIRVGELGEYHCYDMNFENLFVTFATAMFLGIDSNKLHLHCENFLLSEDNANADKIFADPPMLMRGSDVLKKYKEITTDNDVVALYKIYDSLCIGGTAVIATGGRTLFAISKAYSEFRKTMAERGLKAVISMPPLWTRTSVPTELIVLEKDYCGPIEFINYRDYVKKTTGRAILSDENVSEVVSCLEQKKTIEGLCVSVDRRNVICEGSWIANRYIQVQSDFKKARSVEKIDEELDSLYDEFFKNNK